MFLENCWNICGILLLITLINVNSSDVNNDQCVNYCSNGGVCVVVENQPKCYCLPKWEGERCDIVTPFPKTYQLERKANLRLNVPSPLCAYVPDLCSGKGVCFLDDTTSKLACQCSYPSAGLFCTEVSVCKDFCYNNGICEVQTDETPKCINCGDKYTGARCQSVITTTTLSAPTTTTNVVCAAIPAAYCNKGTCTVSQTGSVVCQCPSGYTGRQCEIPPQGPGPIIIPGTLPPGPIIPGLTNPPIGVGENACASNPCRNGRTCYNNGNTFYCLCGSLYQGTYCENYVG